MSWSYSGDPSTSDLDHARFLCGDTDTNDQLLSNEELQYLITIKGSAQGAARFACTAIMAKLAREVDYAIGPERVSAQQRFENYKDLMKTLTGLWTGANAAPSWGGSIYDKSKDVFEIGLHDNGSDS